MHSISVQTLVHDVTVALSERYGNEVANGDFDVFVARDVAESPDGSAVARVAVWDAAADMHAKPIKRFRISVEEAPVG